MKKIILSFAIILASVVSFGQETEHLKFMGIPIDGTLTEFTQKLVQKGFVKSKNEQILTGKFAQEDVDVLIGLTPKSEKVYTCLVDFGEYTSWNLLKNEYIRFRESLIKKYGTPINDVHYFSFPYDEGDGCEMLAVKEDKCNYGCFWNNGIGILILSSGQVCISYCDPINEKLNNIEEDALINEDL